MSAAELFAMAAEVRYDALDESDVDKIRVYGRIRDLVADIGAQSALEALAEIAADAHEHSQDREDDDREMRETTLALADLETFLKRAAEAVSR